MSYQDSSAAPPPQGIPSHVPPELVVPDAPMGGDPYVRYGAMHQGPRVVYSSPNRQRPTGSWVVSRAEDIRAVLQQPEVFSSKGIAGFSRLVGEAWDLIPLELDPPDHAKFRTVLNGIFSPSKIKAMEDGIRARAVSLIDAVVAKGECEFVEAFGRPFPVSIFMQLMGLPEEDTDKVNGWEHDLLHSQDMNHRLRGAKGFLDYLRDLIALRRREPTDDLTTFAINAQVDGRPLTDDEVMGICYLLVVAGLDTVAASLGLHFRHLATHPEDQARLRADPSLIPGAVEELMRAYGIVVTNRFVTQDIDIAGVSMKAGDRVTVPTMAPNLDPNEFEDPMKVDIERSPNRHVAFAYGPHRCIGSHLARRELVIAMEEWLKRVPPFSIKDNKDVPMRSVGLISVEELPLVWG